MNRTRAFTSRGFLAGVLAVAGLAMCCGSAHAAVASPLGFGKDWWINTNYSEHGKSIDDIFLFIFWLTVAILVGVQVVLVWFMIKYRHRPGAKKAVYSHGNTRLEMIWTLIPAVVLIVLALWTKRVWDNYRYSPSADDPHRLKVLVIGEQFRWRVIYPGARGTIGRYLVYPKTTDLDWPHVPPGNTFVFPIGVRGPAYLPEADARRVLNDYIQTVNPLGRDYSDPDTSPLVPAEYERFQKLQTGVRERTTRLKFIAERLESVPYRLEQFAGRITTIRKRVKTLSSRQGSLSSTEKSQLEKATQQIAEYESLQKEAADVPKWKVELPQLEQEQKEFLVLAAKDALNDYENTDRPLVIPKGRPVEIQIGSRDVIHDFFLPNFRTRIDTVPGMRAKLYLTATNTGREIGGSDIKEYSIEQWEELLGRPSSTDPPIAVINEKSPGAEFLGDSAELHKINQWRYSKVKASTDETDTIVMNGYPITLPILKQLRAAGISKVVALLPYYWDIVCEELCGVGHSKMQGKLFVVEEDELRNDKYKNYYPEGK